MKITGRGIVYKNEYGYSITDSKKNREGNWDKYYIPCNFRTGKEPANGTMIDITEGFTSPFKRKDGSMGMSYFIAEYDIYSSAKDGTNPTNGFTEIDPDFPF